MVKKTWLFENKENVAYFKTWLTKRGELGVTNFFVNYIINF